ncbi:peroxiredoxin [Endozoicomonas numazuensis]|uniref:Glutathione-dependent peroxiredoxin n=1 Tax=Endozoicomonas numazuensis TaxID=1137799 RepID=A0A081NJH1_9GAMM|nr:peroxiredoxin [Endozoicomonas numazuensis]KEQ18594.1 peroxiredoxin [Endozoicomonas numazuensis]
MIKQGDRLPSVDITVISGDEQSTTPADAFFADKKAVLFAVPGAFTPTCSNAHLPGYVALADDFKAKGIDTIACLSVNDAFVMQAWSKDQNAGAITMMADGDGELTKALGLEMDTGSFGGLRSQRYAMIIDHGEITLLNVEPPKTFELSKAETLLAALS